MKSCSTCREYIAHSSCGISLESECCEGGGFEAWKPRTLFVDLDHFTNYLDATKYTGSYILKDYGNRIRVNYLGDFSLD